MLHRHLFQNGAIRGCAATIAVFVISSAAHGAGVLYVDDDAPLGGDGTSWDSAYRFLQDAMTNAGGGGIAEIRVGQGTYKPDRDETNPDGTGKREATFQLINGVALMGGYAGIGAKDPDARDIELYETILSGDLLGDDEPVFNFYGDNSMHILTGSSLTQSAIVDGFTIGHGNASTADEADRIGGGLRLDGGIQLLRCTFEVNYAQDKGAAIYAIGGDLLLTECSFVFNWGAEKAGAIHLENGIATLEACSFEANLTGNGGMAATIWASNSDLTLTDCHFLQNDTDGPGGGIYCEDGSLCLIACSFVLNEADHGAGVAAVRSTVVAEDCLFDDNRFDHGRGGGLRLDECDTTMTNCQLIRNYGVGGSLGGGIYVSLGSLVLQGCFLAENHAGTGGGIYLYRTDVTIRQCMFVENDGGSGGGIFAYDLDQEDQIVRCIFEGNSGGSEGGAIRISTGSPRILDSFFRGNSSIIGGAVHIKGLPLLVNCLFSGNSAQECGGALYITETSSGTAPDILNCTIVGNDAWQLGGGVCLQRLNNGPLSVSLANSILWDNTDSGGSGENAQVATSGQDISVFINYSDVMGWTGAYGGNGNIGDDPLFIDADGPDNTYGTEDDNLRLLTSSPCIDAADNTAVPKGIDTDLDGNNRFVVDPCTDDTGNGDPPIVDMGAYEFQVTCPWDLDCNGSVGVGDLLILLGVWGPCPPKGGCPADFDDSGDVGVSDFLELLGNWGPCP